MDDLSRRFRQPLALYAPDDLPRPIILQTFAFTGTADTARLARARIHTHYLLYILKEMCENNTFC